MDKNNSKIIINQREYFRSGKTRPYAFRREALKTLDNALTQYESEFIDALQSDFGKNSTESFLTEIYTVRNEIKDALKHLRRWMRPKRRLFSGIARFPSRTEVIAEPLGTVLIISAWNYPVQLSLAPLIASISGGNCSVIKSSELAPHVSAVLKKMISMNFDPGFISLVEGGVEETTALLKENFNHIFFTGSTAVGRIVMKGAAENLIPVTLELGGKSPCIVDETAQIKTAARRIIWGKFINAGQTCVAPDFVLVHSSVHKQLVHEMKNALLKSYGPSPLGNPDFPSIINRTHFNRLKSLMDPEKVIHGGDSDEQELRIAPTIMDNVSLEDPVMEEEIFGPILPILSFDDYNDLKGLLEDRPSPLAMYFFSENRRRQKELMQALSFGGGCINDVVMHMTDSHLPFGGVGQSGMGNYHGISGFRTFTHEKALLKNTTLFDLPFRYPPYGRRIFKIIKSLPL